MYPIHIRYATISMNSPSPDTDQNIPKEQSELIPLSKAALGTPYSAEYLSLLARRGKLKAEKVGRVWHATKENVAEYVAEQKGSLSKPIQVEESVTTVSDGPALAPESSKLSPMSLINAGVRVATSRGLFMLGFIFLVVLFVVAPFRSVSGFVGDAFRYVVETVKDAQTVMGFRPGTHANEILLLDESGDVSIFGHIETEGQFRSFVEQGVAPFVVESTTLVENLNSEYLDGKTVKEFTLAFVTENGNITYEDVYLEGNVKVGQTLLVRGATKLLHTLEVGDDLTVFGDAVINESFTVQGPSYFKALLNADDIAASRLISDSVYANIISSKAADFDVLTVNQNMNVRGQAVFQGMGIFRSGISAFAGSFEQALDVGGNFAVGGDAEIGRANGNSDITIASNSWGITAGGIATLKGLNLEGTFSPSAISTGNITSSGDIIILSGSVGIGTTSPGGTLGIVGNIVASTTATSTFTNGLDLSGGCFAIDGVCITGSGGGGGAFASAGGYTTLDTTTDSVGIGTTTPGTRLGVSGGILAEGVVTASLFTATSTTATSTLP
ncbi:hypothetical protein COB55_02535, partial [Candidatus Wolfebacteria bacterium]